jgi:hypothetical protein
VDRVEGDLAAPIQCLTSFVKDSYEAIHRKSGGGSLDPVDSPVAPRVILDRSALRRHVDPWLPKLSICTVFHGILVLILWCFSALNTMSPLCQGCVRHLSSLTQGSTGLRYRRQAIQGSGSSHSVR